MKITDAKFWICFLYVLIFGFELQAQNRSFGTLSMIQNPNPTRNISKVDSTHYYKALKIYNRLVSARGDFRNPPPDFSMTGLSEYVAYVDYDKMEIAIENKAYKVCASFGQDEEAALAFLIGHELTHYYEKHAWKSGFAKEFKDLNIGLKIDSLQEDVANETQADYLGGFLAYTAGYGLFTKGGEVIKALYDEYDLPPILKKYPSLSDRQIMSKRVAEKLEQLVNVFELANLLTITGNYSEALNFYKYIITQYQSSELYNNLGVNALLNALDFFTVQEQKYKYPIQIDLNIQSPRAGFADNRDKLIREAILHFNSAISMNPAYATAYLNLACAYALLGDEDRARFYASVEARSLAIKSQDSSQLLAKIDILLGVMEANKGNTDTATALFKKASQQNNILAVYNLNTIENQPPLRKPSRTGLERVETIDGKSLSQIVESGWRNKKSLDIAKGIQFHFSENQTPNSNLQSAENALSNIDFYFLSVKSNYDKPSAKGIKLGDTRDTVINKYGKPDKILDTPTGLILAYNSIIFILNSESKLIRWYLYSKNE